MSRSAAAALAVGFCLLSPVSVGGSETSANAHGVEVDLTNTSDEARTDWPVILPLRNVFGRGWSAATLRLETIRVLDEREAELPVRIESIPPTSQPGSNELVFLIPRIGPGETRTFKVLHDLGRGRHVPIDVVGSPMNLIRNGGFEDGAEHWEGKGMRVDESTRKAGRKALLLEGSRRIDVKYKRAIPLRKGARYYFGVWGRTENVSRHTLQGAKGGTFELPGFDSGWRGRGKRAKLNGKRNKARVQRFCGTRDWYKSRWVSEDWTDWGLQQPALTALADSTSLLIRLDQRRQFTMAEDETEGRWWVDNVVLIEQPDVKVRFDKPLKPLMHRGVIVFSCPPQTDIGRESDWGQLYAARPFPREHLVGFKKTALRGQRVQLLFGVYHTRPLKGIHATLRGDRVIGPDGATVGLDLIEHCAGPIREVPSIAFLPHDGPVDSPGEEGVPYFNVNLVVPDGAKAGLYTGKIDIRVDEKLLWWFPVEIKVVPLGLPVIRDVYIGMIFQGSRNPPFNDEGMEVYARSGFTSVTLFTSFFPYRRNEAGRKEVDLDGLVKKLSWLKSYGITAGVAPFSDTDVGPKWGGGHLYKAVGGDKEAYQEQVRRVESLRKTHPDLPRVIWMTWDEPGWGRNGRPGPKMGWVLEAVPDALTTLDVQYEIMPKCLPYYNMPSLDDPCVFGGPELYAYLKSLGKDFGFAGCPAQGATGRYQTGLMMAGSGARYMHMWHLGRLMYRKDGRVARSLGLLAAGEGTVDYKTFHLLRKLIAEAKAGDDRARREKAGEAQRFLKKVLALWDGDHRNTPSTPYLGLPGHGWTYDGYYDDLREKMIRYALTLRE